MHECKKALVYAIKHYSLEECPHVLRQYWEYKASEKEHYALMCVFLYCVSNAVLTEFKLHITALI